MSVRLPLRGGAWAIPKAPPAGVAFSPKANGAQLGPRPAPVDAELALVM
jgi:hypothetical protein